MISSVWDAGAMRPGGVVRRAAALVLDGLLLFWVVAWLLLPFPGLPAWAIVALAVVYAVLAEGRRGRTLGKKAMGLFVLEAAAGGRAGYRRAAVRWGVRAAPAAPALLAWSLAPGVVAGVVTALAASAWAVDHLWALRHRLGRTLHDLAAGTVVLRVPRPTLFAQDAGDAGSAERSGDER